MSCKDYTERATLQMGTSSRRKGQLAVSSQSGKELSRHERALWLDEWLIKVTRERPYTRKKFDLAVQSGQCTLIRHRTTFATALQSMSPYPHA